jgi:4-amino-4-deoxy-L-arabinose transferase-like glycosyltransferase
MGNHAEESTDAKTRRRWHHSLTFIFVVALVLRLAVITVGHTYRINPRGDHFQFGWEMGRIARSLALDQGFGSPTDLPSGPSAWTPPVYAYILAGVFKTFGIYSHASAWVILAFNSVFGALTCITTYKIGERIYGTTIARAASWTWAVFPYMIYWSVRVVWETSLSTFLLSLALLLTLRMADVPPKTHNWIGFGLLWGFIALTNTALLSMLPFLLLWLLYRSHQRVRLFVEMCVCGLVILAAITPWLIRDYVVFGKFIFIRDNMPLEMQVANNQDSNGLWTRHEHPGNDVESMRRFQELGELRFMEEKQQELQQFIRSHPGQFVAFTLKRALYFWIGTPVNATFGGHNFVPLRHLTFLVPSALAFAGLWWSWRKQKFGMFLFACFLIIYPLPYYLVNPFPRYKHPIEPVMLLLIVYAIWEIAISRKKQPHPLSFRRGA